MIEFFQRNARWIAAIMAFAFIATSVIFMFGF
jgi:hypothetical protein